MKNTFHRVVAALGFLSALFASEVRADDTLEPFSDSRAIASLQFSKIMGGELDLLMPLYGDTSQFWYGNLQGYQYGSTYRTFGVGGGHRQIVDNAIYGIYGFFDRQTSVNKVNYNRYNIGVERLGETWDLRSNFYYYANSQMTNLVDRGRQSASISGNQILYAHLWEIEKVYNGADVEVGRTLGLDSLRGYLGYYNFGDVIKGPKARIEYQMNQRVALSASTQTDTRGWLTYAGISYWFGKTTLPGAMGIQTRMLDPVVRDMTVAATMVDNYLEYDVDPRSVYFAQSIPQSVSTMSVGGGTPSNPYSLQQAINNANDNDIIILLGSDSAYDITNSITLKPGQTLWSNTQDLYANGFLLQKADTTRPVNLINGGINVTNGATLGGFSMSGTGISQTQNGITVNGTQAVNISNVNVTNFNHDNNSNGIQVLGAAPVTLTNVTSNNNGVGLFASAGVITINGATNNFQNNTHGAGIYLETSAQLTSIKNTNTSGNAGDGIYLGGTRTYTTSVFSNITSGSNGGNGYNLANPNATINATSITGNSNTLNGLAVSAGSMAVTSTGNSFSRNALNGINASDTGVLSSLQNATLSNNFNGLVMSGVSVYTATLSSVTASNNIGLGISVNNANVTVNGSTIVGDANGAPGLQVSNGSVAITGMGNSFSNNTNVTCAGVGHLGHCGGIYITGTGQLTSLQNTTTSNNVNSGITIDSTATFNATFNNVTSNANQQNGINIGASNFTVAATNITADNNAENGLLISAGSIAVAGTTNSFSTNTVSGITVFDTGMLTNLENAVVSSNKGGDGISLAGTSVFSTTLTKVTTNTNVGNGININNPNATVNFANITSNGNTAGSGMWINQGVVQDSGSTNNYFNNNSAWGVLVGTSTTKTDAHLLALTNAQVAVNGQDGILFNSSATTDNIVLTNISTINPTSATAASNTDNGIYINQAGTFTFSGTNNVSYNGNSGLRINNNNATMTSNGTLTGDHNTNYGLRVANANTVTINGTGNSFSINGLAGAFLGSTSSVNLSTITANLNNITTQNNGQYGVAIWNNSNTKQITINTLNNNTNQIGFNAQNAVVNLNNAQIYSNVSDGVFAVSGATLTFDDGTGTSSQIYGNVTGGGDGYQIEAQSGSNVIVNNPITLLGSIANTNSLATLRVYYKGVSSAPPLGAPITCTIQNGGGNC